MCNIFFNFKVFNIPGNNLLATKLCSQGKTHKFKYSANKSSRISMEYKSSSDQSFYMSSDSHGNAGRSDGVLPGHTADTLRNYEIIVDNESKTMENEDTVKIKVMNHNVLSQQLLEEHRRLYQKQKKYVLDWSFRKKRLFEEFLAVKPDILCLQEVQESEIPNFYNQLENHGYKSVSKMKTRLKGDGLSLYYKASDIKLVDYDTVEYRQPGIIELENRDNVGLIARLEKGGKHFIVANTHLLFNPKRTEVRLAQVQMLLAEIHRMVRKYGDDPERVLLMGDFNSIPESPVINLIKDAKLLSKYPPLPLSLGVSAQCMHMQEKSKLYHTEKENNSPTVLRNESIHPRRSPNSQDKIFTISHPFNFLSAYDLEKVPNRGVTTFQGKWVMVDYLFYSHGLKMISRLNLPTSAESGEYIKYLPNHFNPSDHLPLVAEFEIL